MHLPCREWAAVSYEEWRGLHLTRKMQDYVIFVGGAKIRDLHEERGGPYFLLGQWGAVFYMEKAAAQCVLRGKSGAVYLPCRKRAIEILRGGGEGLYFMRKKQCYLFYVGRMRFCALRGKSGALYLPLGQRGAASHVERAPAQCVLRGESGALHPLCRERIVSPYGEMAKLPGHALHEKGLQRQKCIGPLVSSQARGTGVSWANRLANVTSCLAPPRPTAPPCAAPPRPARGMSGFWIRQTYILHAESKTIYFMWGGEAL